MPAFRAAHAGFSMVELGLALAILIILAAIAAPNFENFMANRAVRSAAENILGGIQQARSEAIKANKNVRFEFGPNNAVLGEWRVLCVDSANTPQACPDGNTTVLSAPTPSGGLTVQTDTSKGTFGTALSTGTAGGVTFMNLGRTNPLSPNNIVRIDIIHSGPSAKRLVIVIDGSGGARLCDPEFSSSSTHPSVCR